MGLKMEDEVKRWTARRKSALVLDLIQGKTAMAQANRAYDLAPSEVETWLEDGKREMENALRANLEQRPLALQMFCGKDALYDSMQLDRCFARCSALFGKRGVSHDAAPSTKPSSHAR